MLVLLETVYYICTVIKTIRHMKRFVTLLRDSKLTDIIGVYIVYFRALGFITLYKMYTRTCV